MRFRPSAWKKRSRNSDKVNHQKADARVPAFFRGGKIRFFTESWWGANKGLGEAPKSCTRKEHESATNSIAKRGQGAIAPCRVKGQRPLWGLGQRPNCSASDQSPGSRQQRCRQRSVPASNFALPQERPQAALFNIYAVSRQMGATDHPRCLRPSDNHHPCSQISKC